MITTEPMRAAELNDAQLVTESLAGNRDAFRQIVERYQTLISSLAYCATGDVSQGEDLAQETFLRAWTQLAQLREPAKLRPWLCSIARFLISKECRRHGREPIHDAEPLEAVDKWASPGPLPPDHAISAEERALLWRSLERIPEIYREPLVLFYRESQSIESVAQSLDLSEDAVKQRLSRGRKLLQEQLLAFVAGALKQTRPGRRFTVGVIAALPGFFTTAKAATAGTAAVQSSVAAKATGYGTVLKAVLSVLLPVGTFASLGGWLGYRMGCDAGQSPQQQKAVARFWAILVASFFVFVLLPLLLALPLMALFESKEHFLAALRIWLDVMFAVVIGAFVFWIWQRRRLRRQGNATSPGVSKKRLLWSVGLAMIAAGALLALGLSDTNWKVHSIGMASAQKLIEERHSDAEFSAFQYQDGHGYLFIKLQENGKLSKFVAPTDQATLSLLAAKGITCPVYLQGRDFEIFGWQGKLLMGLCLSVFVAAVAVVVTFSLKNKGKSSGQP